MVTPGASEVALPIRIVRSNEELAFGVLDHLKITQRLSENSHFTSHEKKSPPPPASLPSVHHLKIMHHLY